MRLAIADTGPINYLILIGCVDLLPTLFEKVLLPTSVQAELSAECPNFVRNWIADLPAWLEVRETPARFDTDPALRGIHAGEQAGISLATTLKADLLLMDDRKGVIAAGKGLRVTGTLGILELAARNGLTDLLQAINRLRKTNFRSPELLDALLRDRAGTPQSAHSAAIPLHGTWAPNLKDGFGRSSNKRTETMVDRRRHKHGEISRQPA